MAVLMTLDVPGGTTAQYDRMKDIARIGGQHGAPPGLISHACGVTDDGIVVVDVWDSVSSLDDFMRNRVEPGLAAADMSDATLRISPVHDLLFGAGKEPNVLVLLEAPGLTTDAYDAIVAKMPSHAGGGEHHPSVIHVAAADADGFRIADLWDSEAAYKEFAETQLLPALSDPRHFVLRIWPVYDSLLVPPRVHA